MISISTAVTSAAVSVLWLASAPAAQAPVESVSTSPTAIAVDRSVLERYVGTYKSEIGTAKVAVGKNGQLTLQVDRLRPVPLIAESDTQFRPEGVKATLVFHADTNGISHFVLHREGKQIRADRKRSKG